MSRKEKRQARQRGVRAEAVAAWWLRLKGYRIVARDNRERVGEVDLIATRGGVVAFVEVKARADRHTAAYAIGASQRHRIQRAAESFLAGRPALADRDVRFDAMLIVPWRWPIHLVDAWRP